MTDHRAKAEDLTASHDARSIGGTDGWTPVSDLEVFALAQVHATLALVEAADAQVAATKAQTAAMERLGKLPRDTSTRAPGLGW